MNLLAIETTGNRASTALAEGNGRIEVRTSEQTLSHLQNLIPMIEDLLRSCGKTTEDLDAIAVSEGPGSFTGIRIGVATARALGQALDLPCIGVPTLRSFTYHYRNADALLCPMLDARRGQVFAGAYLWENDVCRSLVKDGVYALSEFEELAAAAAGNCGKVIQKLGEDEQDAGAVAEAAFELYHAGRAVSFEELEPVYLRQAEAERKLQERLKKEAEAKAGIGK